MWVPAAEGVGDGVIGVRRQVDAAVVVLLRRAAGERLVLLGESLVGGNLLRKSAYRFLCLLDRVEGTRVTLSRCHEVLRLVETGAAATEGSVADVLGKLRHRQPGVLEGGRAVVHCFGSTGWWGKVLSDLRAYIVSQLLQTRNANTAQLNQQAHV